MSADATPRTTAHVVLDDSTRTDDSTPKPRSSAPRSCLKCGSSRRYSPSPELGRSPPQLIPGRRVSFLPPSRDDLMQGWAELFSFRCCAARKPSRTQQELPKTDDYQREEGFSMRWD
tara:strand:- start:472 stop:822 length:351 start_codon:yes stop_codon:yes gene_type:complete